MRTCLRRTKMFCRSKTGWPCVQQVFINRITQEPSGLLTPNSSLFYAAGLPDGNAMTKHDQQSFSQRFVVIFFSSLPLLGYTVTKSYILNPICIFASFDSFLSVLPASCFNFWLLPFFFLYLPFLQSFSPKL